MVDRLVGEPGAVLIISRLTLVETVSVFARKVRIGEYDNASFAGLRGLFAAHVVRGRYQVSRLLNVHFDRARDLIVHHGRHRQIRTLDAVQLSVALHLHEVAPLDRFVYADQHLCAVAELEGLFVLDPERP